MYQIEWSKTEQNSKELNIMKLNEIEQIRLDQIQTENNGIKQKRIECNGTEYNKIWNIMEQGTVEQNRTELFIELLVEWHFWL